MSVYVVDRDHIVYLVQSATSSKMNYGSRFTWYWKDCPNSADRHREIKRGDFDKMAEVAQMLWDENIRSVEARYPDCVENRDAMPGPIGASFEITPADFTPFAPAPDPVQLLKSCNCLAYQSCEHDEWEQSNAYAFLESLKSAAISALPGYDTAAWGAPERVISNR